MKNLEQIPGEIFDLLNSKKYTELSEKEVKMVDGWMTESEYKDYTLVIGHFKMQDDISVGVPQTSFKPRKKSILVKILNYQVPLYQVAAGLAMLVTASFAFQGSFLIEKKSPNENLVNNHESIGKSLADDDYPEDLVFNL